MKDRMKCKCGCEELILKQTPTKVGRYCKECGGLVSWLNKKEKCEYFKNRSTKEENRGKAIKACFSRNGIITITCGVCGCQLFNSKAPEPIGQFNLLDSKYCPLCGVKFI